MVPLHVAVRVYKGFVGINDQGLYGIIWDYNRDYGG